MAVQTEQEAKVLQSLPVRAEQVMVTPELAHAWLSRNSVNRKIRPNRIERYVRAMLHGHWTITNDAICISPEGLLLNGQHRLTAVTKANIPVPMLVVHNMPFEAMTHMDRGGSRTLSDVLKFMGESNTLVLASVLRNAWLVDSNLLVSNASVDDDDAMELLDVYPWIRESVKSALRCYAVLKASTSALGVAHWMIAKVNGVEVADLYLEQLATRANEPARSPIHAICNRINEARRTRVTPTMSEYLYLLIKGFNYWATGKEAVKISMTPKSEGPITLPQVVDWNTKSKKREAT